MLATEALLDIQVKAASATVSPLTSLASASNWCVWPVPIVLTVGVTTTVAIVDPPDEGALTSVSVFPPPHAVKANAVKLNARDATYLANGHSGPELLCSYGEGTTL